MEKVLFRKLDVAGTIKSYRKVLWFYDLWSYFTESRAFKKILEIADIGDSQSILEIACGTGHLLGKIIAKNPHGENIGSDLSPDMLKKANRHFQKSGLKNFRLIEGNVLDLEFGDSSFDYLFNNFMIDLMPEDTFDKVADEFYRLLKPGGMIIVSTFSFGTKNIHKFWYRVAKNFPGLLTGCRPVSFTGHLKNSGFEILNQYQISQNTFPTEIIKAKKPDIS